ncbi:2-hydroxyacylsphingosine 1-beta-galactosyltransferase [Folsomia candida]|uniref:2-hydroxyacylsphingosine 1-beta-galactosyltransferase n=1 Tax=Folsomia candida TaxID=158441 RepID=UPI000B9010C1|nr:2-hydroxyacylsphingosine 1-beta-galactosyltransferase [Folsomia candida]
MNYKNLFNYFIIFLHFPSFPAEKILFFFGGGSYSMKNSAWPWATELADRGHQVTFLSAHSKQPTKHGQIRDLATPTLVQLMGVLYGIDRFQQRKDHQEKDLLTKYSALSVEICETIFFKSQEDALLQDVIHKESYDLVIVNVIFGECGFVFAAKYNAKTILFDGSVPLPWFFDVYGFHADTSWIPDVLMKYDNFPLTLVDRVTSTIWPLYWYWDRHCVVYPGMDRLMEKAFGKENALPFYELEKNTSLVVVNSHHATDFAYSFPPLVIQIGGIQTWLPEQEIPEPYQSYLDGAGEGGAVLISFGSTIPLEKISSNYVDMFFKLIQKNENVRFILKWNGPLPEKYKNGFDNLLVSSWIPQRELLRHQKIKGFISHGGLNSIQEATFYAVPLIVLPLFADQDYNAFRVDAQKVGVRLEVRDLTFEQLDAALIKILTDSQYKENMKVKSKIFRDRPASPLETVVYWTEFVLRNDDISSIKPMNNGLTWYQRRLLDVYLVYATVIFLSLTFVSCLIFKILKLAFRSNASPKTATKSKKKIS